MSYGIAMKLNQPILGSNKDIFFLHKTFFEQNTFDYTSDKSLWYTFATKDEAKLWFEQWYEARKQLNMMLPSYGAFSVLEIPGSNAGPVPDTLSNEQGGNLVGGGPAPVYKPKF